MSERALCSTRRRRLLLPAVLGCFLSQPGLTEDAGRRLVLQPISEPSGLGALAPHLAADAQGNVVLSWLEPVDTGGLWQLGFSRYRRDAWSPAQIVASGDNWFVNWADFPSVVPLAQERLAAHWLVKRPGGVYAYDVVISQSTDGGSHWTRPQTPHDDDTATEHGFVSLFPWRGEVGAIWLDGRETQTVAASDKSGSAEEPDHDSHHGGMTLRYALLDNANAPLAQGLVDGLVCDCCQTDAALLDGKPVIVFRNRAEQEVRDIYYSILGSDGWTDPEPVAEDGWHMPACPVNGPAIDARDDTAAVAWFTAAGGKARVQIAFSAGKSVDFDSPIVLDEADPLGRVDIVLLDRKTAAVSWLAMAERDGSAALKMALVGRRDGILAESTLHELTASRRGGFPQMIGTPAGLLFAWTEPGDPGRLRTALLRLSAGYLDDLH